MLQQFEDEGMLRHQRRLITFSKPAANVVNARSDSDLGTSPKIESLIAFDKLGSCNQLTDSSTDSKPIV